MGIIVFFTCFDRLTKCCRAIPCFIKEETLSASLVKKTFLLQYSKFFSVLAEVISDRDPRFIDVE